MIKTEFEANFDAIGELVGSLQGIGQGLNEQDYMAGLIRDAHSLAANAFDLAAAATAKAGGGLSHVYEFGTAGITPGPVFFDDPTAADARLWVHTIVGTGGNQEIGFSFRPAVEPNPQPTPASTGVSQQELNKLSGREYVFWNKAFVMETGEAVQIASRSGDYVFVPFYGDPSDDPSNTKGYMMYNTAAKGALTFSPGHSVRGNFTQFWGTWWASEGEAIMSERMTEYVNYDIKTAMAEATKAANAAAVKPVETIDIFGSANRARMVLKRLFGIKRKGGAL